MRKFTLLPALGLILSLLTVPGRCQAPSLPNPGATGQAAGGLSNLIPSHPQDINAAYAVTPQAGLWMICAASYQGEAAPELAFLLCTYLRQKHYPAYVFNRGNEERKKLQQELDQWQGNNPGAVRRWKLAHPEEEQLAVLIGGYKDVDAASSELKKVRKWDLPDIKLKSGKPAFDTYDVYEPVPDKKSYDVKRYPVNPFHTAFVIRNPAIVQDHKPVAKVDPLWKKLNADEPRSLYKCPKPWTLAVQEFRGTQILQTSGSSGGILDKLGFGDHNLGRRLDCSAKMAEDLCDMFRKLGFKSYVLHTRTHSVVTVGEFISRDDPAIGQMQEKLNRFTFKTQSGETPFKLFAKALPMEVPH
jgi:hypothetical protein